MKNIYRYLLLLLIPVSQAFGETSSIYAGVGYLSTKYQDSVLQSIVFIPGQRIDERSNMLNIYAGYQINDYFSAEIGYSEFGNANKVYVFNPGLAFVVTPDNKEDIDFNNISINALFEYPLHDKIRLFGLLGYSFINIDQEWSGGFNPSGPNTIIENSFTEEGIYYGLGAKYLFNDKYLARVQWTRTDANNVTLDAIQVSFQIKIHAF